LQRRDERKPDALAQQQPLLGTTSILGRQCGGIRDRLDPVLARALGQRHVLRHDTRLLGQLEWTDALAVRGREGVEADVGGDAVEPRLQRGLLPEAIDALPRTQHCLLHRVLGVDDGAEHPVAVAGEGGTVLFEEGVSGH
jgi:hypothetical protein